MRAPDTSRPADSIPLASEGAPPAPGFAEALRLWLKLGVITFRSSAGPIALMHQELVERRRCIAERRGLYARNDWIVLPRPEARQLAINIG